MEILLMGGRSSLIEEVDLYDSDPWFLVQRPSAEKLSLPFGESRSSAMADASHGLFLLRLLLASASWVI
jgi:hypothetical protein